MTVFGGRAPYDDLVRGALRDNVRLLPIWRDDSPTTRKKRFVDPTYTRKLFEVYYFQDSQLAPQLESQLNKMIAEMAPDYDLVIVTDFGHGMIGKNTVDAILDSARFVAVNAQSNSANHGFNLITKYPRADYICIDVPEVRLAMGDRSSEVTELAPLLSSACACDRVILTHGAQGCVTFDRTVGPAGTVPAVITKTVIDTVGAGDAFLAVTAPLVAAGGRISDIGFVGNVVGALKVGIVGHRKSVERSALIKAVTALLK
jgi:sugar/nucleoside kinase (ribokinase family)